VDWISRFFPTPAMPPLDLPFAVRWTPGAKQGIKDAYEAVYRMGLRDSLPWGVLIGVIATIFVFALAAMVVIYFRNASAIAHAGSYSG